MRTSPLSLLAWIVFILASAVPVANAAEVAVGDRRESVLQMLGEPIGHIGSSKFEIYYFDRGEVVFEEGRVKSHTLISEKELEARQLAAERKKEARAQRELAEQEERLERGRILRDKALTDPVFAALPPEDRFSFWQNFRHNYPELNIEFEYLIAAREVEAARKAEAEARRQAAAEQQQLRDLERRVEEAEEQARLAQERSRNAYYYDYYEPYYYPSPPTVVIVPDHSKGSRHGNDGDRRRGGRNRDRDRSKPDEETAPPAIVRSELATPKLNIYNSPGFRTSTRQKALRESFATRERQFATQAEARQKAFESRWENIRQR